MKNTKSEKTNNAKGHGLYFAWIGLLLLGTVGSLGLLGISYPDTYIVYAICAVAIISGIAFMIGYFKGEFFKNMHNADYALGLLLIVLGLVFGVQPELLAPILPVIYGFVELYLGAYVLQASLASRRLYCANYGLTFLYSLPALACSLYTLVFKSFSEYYDVNLYYGLMCVSAGLAFLAIFNYWIAVLRYPANSKKVMDKKITAAQLLLESQPKESLDIKVSGKAKRAEKKVKKQEEKEAKKAAKLIEKNEKEAAKAETKAKKQEQKAEPVAASSEDIFEEDDLPVKKAEEVKPSEEKSEDIFVDEDKTEDNDKVIPIQKSASNA